MQRFKFLILISCSVTSIYHHSLIYQCQLIHSLVQNSVAPTPLKRYGSMLVRCFWYPCFTGTKSKTQIKIFLLVAFVVGTFLVNLWLPTKSQGEIKYSVGNWLEGTGTKMVVISICSTKLYDVKGYYCSIMLNSCFYNLIYAGFFLSSLDKIKKSIFWVMVLRNLSLGNGHGYQGSK